MSSYLIEPKAPLLFRDGRPFGASELAETLPFPLPSTVAGALRAAYGERQRFDFANDKAKLLKLESLGPLLAGFELDGAVATLYFPKPADAVYYQEEGGLVAAHLIPGEIVDDAQEGTDLPVSLHPLLLNHVKDEKPAKGAAFWTLDNTVSWLANASDAPIPADAIGVGALPKEIRTHVGIDGNRLTNHDGALFQTAGLDFGPRRKSDETRGWECQSYGLLARFSQPVSEKPLLTDTRFRTIGGKGVWRPSNPVEPGLPSPPF
jgi:CRISPR-associated protein Cmr3